jgi:hypothetical protein
MRSRLTRVAEFALQIYDFLRAYRTYFGALLIFAASRLVVILGVTFGTLLAPATTTRTWDAGPAWYHRLLRWDTGWYASIIHEGYRYSDDPSVPSSTVFYPLYPLFSYALKLLLGIDEYLALLLVANVASVVAVLLMTKIVAEELGDEVALLSLSFFLFSLHRCSSLPAIPNHYASYSFFSASSCRRGSNFCWPQSQLGFRSAHDPSAS